MWITRWREVIEAASTLADALLFESNGTPEEQDEQLAVVRSHYGNVRLLAESSPDDPLVGLRRFFLCERQPVPRPTRDATPEQAIVG